MKPRYMHARTEAAGLLNQLGIGKPPVDPMSIARELDITIVLLKAPDSSLSGLMIRHDERTGGPVIAVNKDHAVQRRRFTVAHELGHYLLHQWGDLRVDRAMISLRNDRSSRGEYTEEIEANQFAAELLMPASWVSTDFERKPFDLGEDDELKALARRYGVSSQAMTFRLANLDLIQL